MRECQECSFIVPDNTRYCPKCDAELYEQNDGSRITLDIAHDGQNIDEAADLMRNAITTARRSLTKEIRLITGTGMIRDHIQQYLRGLKNAKKIKSFNYDGANKGATIVRVK